MKEAYRRGYRANEKGSEKDANPYARKTQAVKFYAWLAGWNDRDFGHVLDLTVFK